MKKVAVIMGSDSDLPIVEKGINVLKEYGVPFEVHVYSAHRTPEQAREFAINARANGFGPPDGSAQYKCPPCHAQIMTCRSVQVSPAV